MNIIEQMLTGEMEMSSFIYLLQSDKHIQNQLRSLVPQGAISNENHIFWKRISFDSLKKNNFDFVKFLYWLCRLDGTIADNLNIYETIRTAYSFSYADIEYTTSYEEAFDLYLDVVKDCYDGPEVREIIEKIIINALSQKSKKLRTKQAREAIFNQFHVEGKKYPRWIQGPEWPMGERTPMRFISQRRNGEFIQYVFMDFDTGNTRTVEQRY